MTKDEPDPNREPRLEEQRQYWAQDLRLKKIGLAISAAGFLLIAGGFIANYLQLRLNTAQAEKLAKSVRINVGNAVTSNVTKLDQVFMSDPWLMPYFYEGKEITKTDKDYPKVSATAEMVLDVFDLVVSQNKNFPEFWDAPQAWDNWVIDMFSTSPILREKLDKDPGWYGKDMKELRRRAGEKMKSGQTSKAPAYQGATAYVVQSTFAALDGSHRRLARESAKPTPYQ